jgi:plasmid stabilization system protein ParE
VYRIVTEPSALADIAHHYRYLFENAHSPGYAEDWYEMIEAAIIGLADFPLRFGIAPENNEFEEEIRHRVVGSYRVIFTIVDAQVRVLHVRHGRQYVLRPDR